MVFLKNGKLMIEGRPDILHFLLFKITSGLKYSPGYDSWLKKLKDDINTALKPTLIT